MVQGTAAGIFYCVGILVCLPAMNINEQHLMRKEKGVSCIPGIYSFFSLPEIIAYGISMEYDDAIRIT